MNPNLLTKRQKQVLKFRCDGMTYDEISRELSISSRTVESHLKRIKETLETSDCSILLLHKAIQLGFYTYEDIMQEGCNKKNKILCDF
ncbi:response regulator transcription factor [Bernardetia sp. OM2101]|uniref:response regulator transcription factor n=1 Tax=Bernardetia sp. OM2101 TaxID=3344876 RepID=UPI0035D08A4A